MDLLKELREKFKINRHSRTKRWSARHCSSPLGVPGWRLDLGTLQKIFQKENHLWGGLFSPAIRDCLILTGLESLLHKNEEGESRCSYCGRAKALRYW